jgi:hypothetical protein
LDESLEFASGTRCARAAGLLAPLVPSRSSFIQLSLLFESSKRVSLYYPRSTREHCFRNERCRAQFRSSIRAQAGQRQQQQANPPGNANTIDEVERLHAKND